MSTMSYWVGEAERYEEAGDELRANRCWELAFTIWKKIHQVQIRA